jgi:hypothetical protein
MPDRVHSRRTEKRRWQFDLKGLLGVIAVLSVSSWLMTHGDESVRFWGKVLLVPVLGGCAGYLAAGWAGMWPGVCLAVLVGVVLLVLSLPFI